MSWKERETNENVLQKAGVRRQLLAEVKKETNEILWTCNQKRRDRKSSSYEQNTRKKNTREAKIYVYFTVVEMESG